MPRVSTTILHATGPAEAKPEAGHEGVIVTLESVATDAPDAFVVLLATAKLTTPAEAEEVTLRIRRGGLTGTEVASVTRGIGASGNATVTLFGFDDPGDVAGEDYVLTLEEKKATVQDTAHAAQLVALY